jgi:molybdate transport system substrate-binding protein
MKMRSLLTAGIGLIFLLAQGFAAHAAEIKVIVGSGMRPVWQKLAPEFERMTGHKLDTWYGINATIKRRMEANEAFDLFVSGQTGVEEYTRQGKIASDSHVEIARVGMGVGARAGTPKPDISSVEAFKRALLNANSVTYSPNGAVGIHLVRVLERLGIAEEVKAKSIPVTEGVVQAIADGKGELGFAFTNSFLSVGGVELVGPFPAELQRYNVYVAGVATRAEQPEAARILIKFLRSSAAIAVIKSEGMEPATP